MVKSIQSASDDTNTVIWTLLRSKVIILNENDPFNM